MADDTDSSGRKRVQKLCIPSFHRILVVDLDSSANFMANVGIYDGLHRLECFLMTIFAASNPSASGVMALDGRAIAVTFDVMASGRH